MSKTNDPKSYILRIRTLDRTWHDRVDVLLHAAMQVLVDFIEGECTPSSPVDWNADPEHKRIRKELQTLYVWWTKKRPKRKEICEFTKGTKEPSAREVLGSEDTRKKYAAYFRALDRYNKAEEQWEKEDRDMLHRLIDVREHMWT